MARLQFLVLVIEVRVLGGKQIVYTECMETILHFITEPDHIIYAVAVAVMALGKTNKRWFWAFTLSGLAWVVLSHIFIG